MDEKLILTDLISKSSTSAMYDGKQVVNKLIPKLADKVTRIKQITGPDFNIWIHGMTRFSSADSFISDVASINYRKACKFHNFFGLI